MADIQPPAPRRVVIEPVSRVEGHGKVTLLLDDAGRVTQARLHIVEFRGFEKFITGRTFWEVPVLVQRLCGICPISHHLAAGKAVDMLVGARVLTPTADKVRRLAHLGQTLQSHALHFFHLSSPDLLLGFDAEVGQRNLLGVLAAHPEVARRGIALRAYGQEVLRLLTGKRVHGVLVVPGGINQALGAAARATLQQDIDQIVTWCQDSVTLARELYLRDEARNQAFGSFRSSFLGLTRADGALELYDGGLRARDADGQTIFDHVDPVEYTHYLREEVRSWTYLKFPYIASRGRDAGWYRVGPLARVNNADSITTPLAEAERVRFRGHGGAAPVWASLAYHWARMIEMLHCAEAIRELLGDAELGGSELVVKGERQGTGIGVIEAPRGTLFHHYEADDRGLITRCNLIVSTTSNNQAMNTAVERVAAQYFDGRAITEGLLNHIEVAIRAYDPCLSCATHALGQMPLEVSAVAPDGAVVDLVRRAADGTLTRPSPGAA